MQKSYDQYKNLDSSGFALDEEFINWVINPDEKSEVYWKTFLLENHGQLKNVEEAKRIIISFQQQTKETPEEVKDRVWQKVIMRTQRPKVITMQRSRVWMSAAAAFFVLVLGGIVWYYFNNSTESVSPLVAKKELTNGITPGGNKATLTLSDGSSIILDSAQNGLLSTQGNSQVLKSGDGKVVYQKENNEVAAIQYNTITTPRGGQYQLTLADGSRVWLNAASSITFATSFAGEKREVKITGEAYFEVAHNAKMPFQVSVNGVIVKVLGTHFNVNAYEDEGEIKTTLLEGSVEVRKEGKSVVIKPGEQASINNGSNSLSVNKSVNLEEVVAWKNGLFQFDDTDIKNVMQQIGRWYDLNVVFDGNVQGKKITGKIYRDVNISKVLKLMEALQIHFKIEGKNLIVTK